MSVLESQITIEMLLLVVGIESEAIDEGPKNYECKIKGKITQRLKIRLIKKGKEK